MSFADLRRAYLDQPGEIHLETLASCNARCTFCPYPTLERIGERLPDALIERLIDEMAGFRVPFMFSPFKVNEPLLDKRTIPLCASINRRVPLAGLRLFTNGVALTDANIEGIARLQRVAHLWISLNSHRPEEYEELMGLPFDRTAKRLDRLHQRPFPHPVVLSAVGFPNEEFQHYCRERWPKFQCFIIDKSAWLGYTEAREQIVPNSPCDRWFELSITATGVVSLCCMDGQAAYPIGDVRKQTLLEIYNTPAYRERREKSLSRMAVKPCDQCTY